MSPASGHARGGPPEDARTAVITAGAAAQAAAENFPVALRLLPARYRRHLMAVYRFARTVDDIGDAALPAAAARSPRRPARSPRRPAEPSARMTRRSGCGCSTSSTTISAASTAARLRAWR